VRHHVVKQLVVEGDETMDGVVDNLGFVGFHIIVMCEL
jgi:hypothetical protein